MATNLRIPTGMRIRLATSMVRNRLLDLAFAPVLKHLTDEEWFGSRTRLEATARFMRRGAWFGNRRARAASAGRLASWHAEADHPRSA